MGLGSMLSGRPLRLALLSTLSALALMLAVVGVASADSPFDMRGEWVYTLTCSCGQNSSGSMLLRQMEFPSGKFSGTTELGGLLSGTVTGVATSTSVSLELYFPSTPFGESRFTLENVTLETAKGEFSGAGTYNPQTTGMLSAKRVRTLAQVEKAEQEAAERAKEAREKAEQEAKERELKEAEEKPIREKAEAEQREREATEKAQKEATEKQQAKEQQEAREKQQAKEEQEAKEAQQAKEQQAAKAAQEAKEREAKAAAEAALHSVKPPTAPTPAKPSTKTIAISNSGLVSLELSNPNAYGISGEVALMAGSAKASGSSTGSRKSSTLAASSFAISTHAKKLVKLKLSRSAAATLANRGSLRVVIKITTGATEHSSITKTYSVTLQSPSRTRH
jgi:outer membrane biosynthesis protein TonB